MSSSVSVLGGTGAATGDLAAGAAGVFAAGMGGVAGFCARQNVSGAKTRKVWSVKIFMVDSMAS
jgi:hypothetical protein